MNRKLLRFEKGPNGTTFVFEGSEPVHVSDVVQVILEHAYQADLAAEAAEVEARTPAQLLLFAEPLRRMSGWIYFYLDGDRVKVGYSSKPPRRRTALQTGNSRPLIDLGCVPGDKSLEAEYHAVLRPWQIVGGGQEWFDYSAAPVRAFIAARLNVH